MEKKERRTEFERLGGEERERGRDTDVTGRGGKGNYSKCVEMVVRLAISGRLINREREEELEENSK